MGFVTGSNNLPGTLAKDATNFHDNQSMDTQNQGVYSKVVTTSGEDLVLSGSNLPGKGFIVVSAGSTVLTPAGGGDPLTASNLTAKVQYDISVSRVSGSGTVNILY
jgi:hypothetical protein